MTEPIDRRRFLQTAATASAAATAVSFASSSSTNSAVAAKLAGKTDGPQVVAFTKSFQDRPIPEVCQIFKSIGLDGLDLTVRPGGHIDPKDVKQQLPAAVKAAHDHGVQIPMLTTAITDNDQLAENILATAAETGVGRIKMGYYRYEKFGTLAQQIQAVRKRVASVVKLAAKHQVLPCIHIHSGKYIPSHGTMLYEVLRDFSPSEVGAYVDPLHMTLEGGNDGWRQGLDLLAPWISLVSMKNFKWEMGERDNSGQMEWHTRLVPVADGIAQIPEFVKVLKQLGYNGIYSMHSEYKGRHSFKDMNTDECIQQTAADLKFFKPLL